MDVWLAIVTGGIATYATRSLPLLVALRLPERGAGRRYLDALPTSIIAALAGAATFAPEQHLALGPEIVGAAVAVAVTAWRRNLLLSVVAAVAAVAVIRNAGA